MIARPRTGLGNRHRDDPAAGPTGRARAAPRTDWRPLRPGLPKDSDCARWPRRRACRVRRRAALRRASARRRRCGAAGRARNVLASRPGERGASSGSGRAQRAGQDFDLFRGQAARSQKRRHLRCQIHDRRFDADDARPVVEHQVDRVAQRIEHVLRAGGADGAGRVCARRRDGSAGFLQQRSRRRAPGRPHGQRRQSRPGQSRNGASPANGAEPGRAGPARTVRRAPARLRSIRPAAARRAMSGT